MSDTAAAQQETPNNFWTVHQGDARELDGLLRQASAETGVSDGPFLQTTITSPPYATLVDYGSENQIGFGQSYADYLESCRAVFEAVSAWTLDTGSMWVVADSLMTPQRAGKPSRFVALPFDLAAEAAAVGWTLREVVIWRKDRTRPWSHAGKLRNGFEYVLFFVKSNGFKFNVDSLRETGSLKSWWVKYPERHNPWGMTPDNVWEIPIPVQGSWADSSVRHACPFPPELVRRMVALSTDEGDVVFDPFAGSGIVIATATEAGRRGLGIELNPDYVDAFHSQPPAVERSQRVDIKTVGAMTQRLLELRMLKYPKELANQLLRSGFTSSQIRAVHMSVESVNWKPARTGYASIRCSVIADNDLSEIEAVRLSKLIEEITGKAPLSKYGLDVKCEVVALKEGLADVIADDATRPLAVYTRGRTWHAALTLPARDARAWLLDAGVQTTVPIISSLRVEQTLEESL